MLTGVHFLLTYRCPYECDHCFLHCSPESGGAFSAKNLKKVFRDIAKMPSVKTVFFEGGEPFLAYPLMLVGLRLAKWQGLHSGIVTNAFWATSHAEAHEWLLPLKALSVGTLSISDDSFHGDRTLPRTAMQAAEQLGIPCGSISIDPPSVIATDAEKGEPIVGGGVRFRGRAAENLTDGLPRLPASSFQGCRHEDLADPHRVHVDGYGNVQICQGITIGNCLEQPLYEVMASYEPHRHPICGPLLAGGPGRLAEIYGFIDESFVDGCHCCYSVRKRLMSRYASELTPGQAYENA